MFTDAHFGGMQLRNIKGRSLSFSSEIIWILIRMRVFLLQKRSEFFMR